jgi:predicted RNase H-like HicB family nuclease
MSTAKSDAQMVADFHMSWEDERIMREQAIRKTYREARERAAKALELATESTRSEKDPS